MNHYTRDGYWGCGTNHYTQGAIFGGSGVVANGVKIPDRMGARGNFVKEDTACSEAHGILQRSIVFESHAFVDAIIGYTY